jgi:hypothetical protein
VNISLPVCAFKGKDVNKLRKSRGVLMDPISVIARTLLDTKVVGKKGQKFLCGYEEGKFGNFNTGEAVKLAQKEIHAKHGPDVDGLYIIFALDKTHLTEDGNVILFVYGVIYV